LRLIASRDVDGADLQLAFDTSDLAADLVLASLESGGSATLKADGTPATEADRAGKPLPLVGLRQAHD
jgi:histidinol-phosphatase